MATGRVKTRIENGPDSTETSTITLGSDLYSVSAVLEHEWFGDEPPGNPEREVIELGVFSQEPD